MSTSFIDEYLVKLGASVDQSGMARFHQALREASTAANASATSIAGAFFKAQVEIVGGFAAIGTAALGLVDKVAMADQQYRLFALHMYMSKDAARALKVAMDALGEPLENLTWDPELRERTQRLIADQRAMAPDGDFEGQMRKIRDIRFEFTRMEVEGQYLAMHVVQDFMKALGFGPDELLKKLRGFNDWVTHDLPQISARLVHLFMPVWNDVKDVVIATKDAMLAVGLAFTNIVGAMTGDKGIEGMAFDFEKFAKALQHVVHWFAIFAEIVDKVIEGVADLTAGIAEMISVIPAPILDAAIGAAVGGFTGGPVGAVVGGVGGAALGAFGGGTKSSGGSPDIHAMIDKWSASLGVNAALAHSLANAESGERQYDANGRLKMGVGSDGVSSSAAGAFQLLNKTAKALGVDSSDPDQNVKGGITLLAQLLRRYNGDAPAAIAAYHDGPDRVNAAMAGRATLSTDAMNEVARVMRGAGVHGDVHVGSIVVHVDKPNAVNADVANAVRDKLRDTQNKQVQRHLAEFQDLSWSTT